jgi:hypothetical protein
MSAYSDEDDAAYDSDAAFDSGDDDANALLDDDVRSARALSRARGSSRASHV